MLALIILVLVFIFAAYLVFDFSKKGANDFANNWLKKTLWIWLPFYGLYYLTRDLIAKLEGRKK